MSQQPQLVSIRDIAATWRTFMGIEDDGAAVIRDYASAPADDAFLYRCLQLKADFARRVPLRVWRLEGTSLVEPTSDPLGQDLADLIEHPNPASSWDDFAAWAITSLSVWGETIWQVAAGRVTGRPRQLWWLRPPDVSILPAPDPAQWWWPTYRYKGREFAGSEIVHIRRPNPADPMRGLSPLAPLRWDVAASRSAAEAGSSLIANWSVPPGAWVPEKDATVTEEDRRLIVRIFRALRGPRGRGRVPVLTTPLRWQQMGLSPADAEWLSLRKASRLAVCAALGVPLALAGDDEHAGFYRSVVDAERVFARTMQGELEMLSDAINARIAPAFGPYRVAWDYGDIPALQVPWETRWDRWLAAVAAMVATPNEMRREFRLGPPLPWGDEATPRSFLTLAPEPRPSEAAESPTAAAETGTDEEVDAEVAETIRSLGRGLYRHHAVRAHIDAGAPLDVERLVGRPVPERTAERIRAAIRRRASAEQIAAELEHAR